MLKNKKIEVRVVTDEPRVDSETTGSEINYIFTRTFVHDTAWVIGTIMILKFGLRIAEHIIVTRLKY